MTEKNRKVNYPLMIILNVISTLLLICGAVYFLYLSFSDNPDKFTISFGFEEYKEEISKGIFLVCIIQYMILRKPLKKLLNQAVLDNEYDEFGVSKKKKFENLTRKEREEMDLQKAAQMEQLLSTSVLKRITKKGSTNPDEDLKKIIGLAPVKQKVTEMAARMKFEKDAAKSKKKSNSSYGMNGRHFCFYGSAGTGKTTFARIITGYLYQYGYIKENKLIEINGGFLKEGELSETKTKMIIQRSYGGVLFIDEAYSIIEGNANYGRAVIAELIKEMEDNRDKFTLILAGYKEDIKHLIESNEGFKSRIKEYFEFPDYSVEEMKEIFESMAHSAGFAVSLDAMNNFEIRCGKEKRLSSFGNGRTARNILDESIDRHALNYGMGKLTRTENGKTFSNAENRFILCGCDVSTSINKNVI